MGQLTFLCSSSLPPHPFSFPQRNADGLLKSNQLDSSLLATYADVVLWRRFATGARALSSANQRGLAVYIKALIGRDLAVSGEGRGCGGGEGNGGGRLERCGTSPSPPPPPPFPLPSRPCRRR